SLPNSRGAEIVFFGQASQEQLPALYALAKVFLFPTTQDAWGIVANEASAAGLPVIVSPAAGAAGELVVDGVNGHVLDLDVDAWATAAARLLGDEERWQRFSERASAQAKCFTFEAAARGIADAVWFSVTGSRPG